MEVDPEDLEDGAGDDDGVEAIEGGGEEGGRTESIHTNVHLEDKGTKEQEFGVNCKIVNDIRDCRLRLFIDWALAYFSVL